WQIDTANEQKHADQDDGDAEERDDSWRADIRSAKKQHGSGDQREQTKAHQHEMAPWICVDGAGCEGGEFLAQVALLGLQPGGASFEVTLLFPGLGARFFALGAISGAGSRTPGNGPGIADPEDQFRVPILQDSQLTLLLPGGGTHGAVVRREGECQDEGADEQQKKSEGEGGTTGGCAARLGRARDGVT